MVDLFYQKEYLDVVKKISPFFQKSGRVSFALQQQCRLSHAKPSIRAPDRSLLLTAMVSLLNRVKMMALAAPEEEAFADQMEEGFQRHPKRALRGWRVIMDKIFTLLLFSELQRIVEEWFPQSMPSLGSSSVNKEETLEDVYAELIKDARPLAPLKSKVQAPCSPTNCVRPKHRLKGGGNAAASYIVCKECDARWENVMRAADIKKRLKENKANPGGLLGQRMELEDQEFTEEMPKPMAMKPKPKSGAMASSVTQEELRSYLEEERMKNVEMQRQLKLELDRQKRDAVEREKKNEALIRCLVEETKHQAEPARPDEVPVGTFLKGMQCKCGKPAELLTVKKEGPRKGRTFWKCVQRQCDLFVWTPLDQNPKEEDTVTSQGSYSMVTEGASRMTRRSPSNATRRSKSPRRSKEDNPGRSAPSVLEVSDEEAL